MGYDQPQDTKHPEILNSWAAILFYNKEVDIAFMVMLKLRTPIVGSMSIPVNRVTSVMVLSKPEGVDLDQ